MTRRGRSPLPVARYVGPAVGGCKLRKETTAAEKTFNGLTQKCHDKGGGRRDFNRGDPGAEPRGI